MSWRARISTNLQELRFLLCPTSNQSAGARSFILNNYSELKKLNPQFPFLVREGTGAQPMVYAVYDFGEEEERELSNLSEQQVSTLLQQLVERGEHMPRSEKQSNAPLGNDILAAEDRFKRNLGWQPTFG